MLKYILRRLGIMIFIVIGVAFVVFSIMELSTAEPALIMLGDGATAEAVAAFNEMYGLNDPFLVRFGKYIWNLFTKFDFGSSWLTNRPVLDTLMERVPVTIIISLSSMAFASFFGVFLGVISAVKQYSGLDYVSRVTAMVLSTIPVFWLGMLLAVLFALKLHWLPASGDDTWKHFVMPMLTLGLPYAAKILRSTRGYMMEAVRQDYIRTARAKGVPERKVVWTHAFVNACLPVINIIGVYTGGLLAGTVVTETVFGCNGVGSFIIASVKRQDVPAVTGGTVYVAIIFALILLIVDLIYAFVDPRIKARYTKGGK